VRRDGDLLRITVQLIDAGTGYHVWSESYDRDVGSVFAVQDEIARAIVQALELKLGGGRSGAPLARQQTSDPEAHTLVLRATQLRRTTQRAQVEEAVRLLQQAIARDSTYAQAWALLSDSYTRLDYLGFAARKEVVPKAREAAERARRLDPQSADAEFALGVLARDYDWDTRGAEAHFRRAIELRPSMASAYTVLAWSLAQLGRGAEAIEVASRAVELDPVQGGLHTNLGSMYAYAGQPQQAVEAYTFAPLRWARMRSRSATWRSPMRTSGGTRSRSQPPSAGSHLPKTSSLPGRLWPTFTAARAAAQTRSVTSPNSRRSLSRTRTCSPRLIRA
jgi:hypothetical protein